MGKNIINIEELKAIQLSILDEVTCYCENNGLKYFLGYGTLIGAIRHKGYIPWDDDIDIIMPRPDYERLINSFNATHNVRQVIAHTLNSYYSLPFAKVYDTRTCLHETMYKDKGVFGVYIDIFPLDGYGDVNQIKRINRLSEYLNAKKAVIDRQRSIKKNIIILIGKLLLLRKSIAQIVESMDIIAKTYSYESSNRVKSFFSVYGENEVCERVLLEETIKAEFEGKEYCVPKNYDAYLRLIYGDYMQLPPIEKRVTHHIFEAWWK